MPNIVLTRIDNRLVHGQVATQWCGSIGASEGTLLISSSTPSSRNFAKAATSLSSTATEPATGCHPVVRKHRGKPYSGSK